MAVPPSPTPPLRTNGMYHSNGCQSGRPDSGTTEDTLLNPSTYDLIQNHPFREVCAQLVLGVWMPLLVPLVMPTDV